MTSVFVPTTAKAMARGRGHRSASAVALSRYSDRTPQTFAVAARPTDNIATLSEVRSGRALHDRGGAPVCITLRLGDLPRMFMVSQNLTELSGRGKLSYVCHHPMRPLLPMVPMSGKAACGSTRRSRRGRRHVFIISKNGSHPMTRRVTASTQHREKLKPTIADHVESFVADDCLLRSRNPR